MSDIHDGVYAARLREGPLDRYHKVELRGRVFTITTGDVGAPGKTGIRTYATHGAGARRLRDELIKRAESGYLKISLRKFNALRRPRKNARNVQTATDTRRPESAKRPSRREDPESTADRLAPAPRRARGGGAVRVRRSGPWALALTGAALHFLNYERVRVKRRRFAPRATSGGRPILAENQPWPVCGRCEARLGLYVQFDIDARFQLAFKPGSHFLLFHCTTCDPVPDSPPRGRLPEKWLRPDFRSTYRVILNGPNEREIAHKPDPLVLEQSLSFVRGKESLSHDRAGAMGLDDMKLGGIPSWRQGPDYPVCACGAPMGFVMQVPPNILPGWKARNRQVDLPFSAELWASVFFCSVQSSPYAGVIVAQR